MSEAVLWLGFLRQKLIDKTLYNSDYDQQNKPFLFILEIFFKKFGLLRSVNQIKIK